MSSTVGASRFTSSSILLNHLTFVVDVTGARFATYYPGIALIVACSLLWSPSKDAFARVDFATIWKEYEIGAELTSTLVL